MWPNERWVDARTAVIGMLKGVDTVVLRKARGTINVLLPEAHGILWTPTYDTTPP